MRFRKIVNFLESYLLHAFTPVQLLFSDLADLT